MWIVGMRARLRNQLQPITLQHYSECPLRVCNATAAVRALEPNVYGKFPITCLVRGVNYVDYDDLVWDVPGNSVGT